MSGQVNTSRLGAPPSGRSVSPYDNLKPSKHPPEKDRPQRGKVFQSTDSLSGFNGDISASSDDESGIARTQSINSLEECADSWPRSRRGRGDGGGRSQQPGGSVTSSLPDLVTSSEIGRRTKMNGSFIGGVRDIDSLLGFGETEDELEVKSDDDDNDNDTTTDDSESAASYATSQERQELRDVTNLC